MKKSSKIIWGVVLIIAGVLFALNALNITDVDVFFDGWWTLFIIVPHLVGIFTERDKKRNLFWLAVGVLILLCCQGILDFSLLFKLIVPCIIVVIGAKMLFGGLFGNKANKIISEMEENGIRIKTGCATFSVFEMNCNDEVFEGAELTATFGSVKCDLRNAIIAKDCAIKVSAIFGGIDIMVPDNVNVKVDTTNVFGGSSNKTPFRKNVPTVYISGPCMFGGVEIK